MEAELAGGVGPVWYQDAYFRANLAETITTCVDSERQSYIVYLSLGGCSRAAARMLYNCARDEMGSRDFAGLLDNGDYAICLNDTDLRSAAAFGNRLERQLSGFEAVVGLAGLGTDGATTDEVLSVARRQTIAVASVAPVPTGALNVAAA
jgi:hypothetical protein